MLSGMALDAVAGRRYSASPNWLAFDASELPAGMIERRRTWERDAADAEASVDDAGTARRGCAWDRGEGASEPSRASISCWLMRRVERDAEGTVPEPTCSAPASEGRARRERGA